MKLHTLTPAKGSVRNNTRKGRGQGSGKGGTSTRGHKGAKSRSGYSQKIGFEGGQMPLQRRVPKFGFKNPNRVEFKVVNLHDLQSLVEKLSVDKIGLEELINAGLVSKKDKVKILNRGELTSAIEVSVHAFSATALESIEKAGGKAITL